MNLAFADRDFYYGDPYFPPEEPLQGLLSKEYADDRRKEIDWKRNDPAVKPGDPYPFEGKQNPYLDLLKTWGAPADKKKWTQPQNSQLDFRRVLPRRHHLGEAADEEGWVVSVTPSGGWMPAFIAGRTGIGLSQRMQSFVLDPAEGPFNVLAPGKRPRVTLTPSLALKDGKPWLAFAVQGGDTQDQNLLQFFLDVVEFGMTVQEAMEATEHHQLPDAQLLRRSRLRARTADRAGQHPAVGAAGAPADGLQGGGRGAQLRPDQRHPARRGARHDVGRIERLRRGLWNWLVS